MPAVDRLAYLERIGLTSGDWASSGWVRREPSLAALTTLHRAHLEHVPFENLDIHLGRRIELVEERLIDKIVGGRGGFCYELNGAFAALLRSLGYRVELLEARVFAGGSPGIAFDHLCLLVELDDRYLADVGFGDSFVEPIAFDAKQWKADPAGTFEVRADTGDWFDLYRDGEPQYRFSIEPRALADFEPGSRHHQTSQQTSFTRRPVCTLLGPNGRTALKGLTISTTTGHNQTERTRTERIVDAANLAAELADGFGVLLTADDDAELLAAAAGSGAVLFESAVGRCGVGWRENRIISVVLPEASDAVTLRRAASDGVADGSSLRPPLFVQRGIDAMVALLAGERRRLDDVLVDFDGVPEFDRAAYEVARSIPPGEVMTYGAVAKRLGQPGAAQAVGGAMGRNPVPIIVPCHRVIAADGQLGGFSANGGTVTKRHLLDIEGAPIDRALF